MGSFDIPDNQTPRLQQKPDYISKVPCEETEIRSSCARRSKHDVAPHTANNLTFSRDKNTTWYDIGGRSAVIVIAFSWRSVIMTIIRIVVLLYEKGVPTLQRSAEHAGRVRCMCVCALAVERRKSPLDRKTPPSPRVIPPRTPPVA